MHGITLEGCLTFRTFKDFLASPIVCMFVACVQSRADMLYVQLKRTFCFQTVTSTIVALLFKNNSDMLVIVQV